MRILTTQYLAQIESAVANAELEKLPDTACILDAGTPVPAGCDPASSIALIPARAPQDVIEYAAASGLGHLISVNPTFRRNSNRL
jgi:hypothetical protein